MMHNKAAIVVSTIIEKIQLITGIALLVIYGLCTIMAFFNAESASEGFLPVCIFIDVLGLLLVFLSRKRQRLIIDFKKYVTALSVDSTGSIINLAASMGTSEEEILKNLDKMIHKKYFTDAYIDRSSRVCLKIAFRQLCVPLCGRFAPDEGVVVGYVDRIRGKYTAKWGVQMAEMNFQTHSDRIILPNRISSTEENQNESFFGRCPAFSRGIAAGDGHCNVQRVRRFQFISQGTICRV